MAATHEDRNAQLSPGVAIKAPCRVATTAAITLSGEQTIDAVACVTGDRVLVKNQTNSIANGIYGVSTGAWAREPDFDGNRDVVTGTFVFITSGATNAGAFYECTTTGTVVFGTSNITFAQGALGPIAIPISGSNVTFTQSGTPTANSVAAKLQQIISVKDAPFNALGDGVTDDTAAIQAAINAVTLGASAGTGDSENHYGLSGALYVPASASGYVVSNLNIYAPITIFGAGSRGSWFKGKAGATGYMWNIDGFNAAAPLTNENSMPNVCIMNLGMDGTLRQANYGAFYLSSISHFIFENLEVNSFNRESFNLFSSVIEGIFRNIRTRFCGNKTTGYANVSLFDQHAVVGERDANNGVAFENFYSIYSYGDHFVLDTLAGRAFLTRDIWFKSCYVHGLQPGINTFGNSAPDATQQTASNFVIKSATNTAIDHVRAINAGTGVPFIMQQAGSHATGPSGTIINGFFAAGRYASTGTQVGIDLQVGDMSVDNINISGGGATASIRTAASTTLYQGDNVVLAEAPSYTVNTVKTRQRGPMFFDMARSDKRVALSDGATVTPDASLGTYFTVTFAGSTRTMAAPLNPPAIGVSGDDAQEITFELSGGNGGGVPTTITWNTAYKLRGGTFNVGDQQRRTITFRYNSSQWEETGRATIRDGGVVTLTDASPIAVDGSLGNTFVVTITAARQLQNPTNRQPGQEYTFIIIQDGTGGRALTFDTAYKNSWVDTGNTLNKRSTIKFVDDASTTYMIQVGAQSPYMT